MMKLPRSEAVAIPAAAAKRGAARCQTCSKRLPPAQEIRCRCDLLFCALHIHSHPCTFSYHSLQQRTLQETLSSSSLSPTRGNYPASL